MWERTAWQRLGVIGLALLFAAYVLSSGGLRLGLDIAGGASMIFEIDDTGIDAADYPGNLAEQMIALLKERVDPNGVYDLAWRPVGDNRIEVQMPLPPPGTEKLRNEFLDAQTEFFELAQLSPSEIRQAVAEEGAAREQALQDLARESEERLARLRRAAQRWDEWQAAQAEFAEARQAAAASTQPAEAPNLADLELAERDARENYLDAQDRVLDLNLNTELFRETLQMDPERGIEGPRTQRILHLKERYPELKAKIDEVVAKYDAWQEVSQGRLESPADLRRLLRGAGVLEFRILVRPDPQNPARWNPYRERLQERGPLVEGGDPVGWFEVENPLSFFNLQTPTALADFTAERAAQMGFVAGKYRDDWYVLAKLGNENGLLANESAEPWELKSVRPYFDPQQGRAVMFELDAVGGQLFSRLTSENIGEPLAILLDDVVYSAPTIQSRISTQGNITGNFTRQDVDYLINTMRAGSLPARLKDTPLSERTIGSSLGQSNLHRAWQAGVIGIVLVIAFMLVYYFIAGAIANIALLLNVLFVLAMMSFFEARISLAGIAGIILTIGMTVDANVLIFERMREEKERGSSLRMIIKNGYDKALSTIVDANITTLLTCVILYFIGSEEIKGFGLTLGWGIILSLFTSLFVTRTIFSLLVRYQLIKDIKMLRLFGTPKIDWYSKRKWLVPISVAVIVAGITTLFVEGAHTVLDVEFLGGTNAEIELTDDAAGRIDDQVIDKRLNQTAGVIANQAEQLRQAEVARVPDRAATFRVAAGDVPPQRLAALITEPLEDQNLLARNGVDASSDPDAVLLSLRASGLSAEDLQARIRELAGPTARAARDLEQARVGAVREIGFEQTEGSIWSITTTATNKRLVQEAVVNAIGADNLVIQPQISFTLDSPGGKPYPITSRLLEQVIPDIPTGGDVTDFVGGAAIYVRNMDPPQSVEALKTRLRNMRLQPDYDDLPWRSFDVIGINEAGADSDGRPVYSSVVVAVADPQLPYDMGPENWSTRLALPEQRLVETTLESEQTLRKVTQFKPEIADRAKVQALLALFLSWLMIIAYLWIRFGRVVFGVAGVAALIHDATFALAMVGISGFIAPYLGFLLVQDFKIDMVIVAAILTIIGYSINDTIVVFDRIRENRGRLGVVTPQIINDSINQCLSRTVITSLTTLLVLVTMYFFGGSAIRGFNYCMILGVIIGTYSSIAIASPILMFAREERVQQGKESRVAPA